jgi:GT2 family glycosyltransferase
LRTDAGCLDADMKLSVIIPTCDRPSALAACLDRLAATQQTIAAHEYEIVVSNDGLDEPVRSMLSARFPLVRLTDGPRRGPAANRNCGATLARGEWLAFTDDDCLPDAGWLARIRDAAEDCADAVAIEGAVLPADNRTGDLIYCPENRCGQRFWSANIAVRREVFFAVGGFDEHYTSAAHEDQDLYLRLHAVGPVPFAPEAIVFHPTRRRRIAGEIARISPSLSQWVYHTLKHGVEGGDRTSLGRLVTKALGFHLRRVGQELSRAHWGETLISGCTLVAIPALVPVHYLVQKRHVAASPRGGSR